MVYTAKCFESPQEIEAVGGISGHGVYVAPPSQATVYGDAEQLYDLDHLEGVWAQSDAWRWDDISAQVYVHHHHFSVVNSDVI